MRRLRGLLTFVVAVIAALLTPTVATASETAEVAPVVYGYDAHYNAPEPTSSAIQRAPPTPYDSNIDYDSDGQLLVGASTRSNTLRLPAIYDYDHLAQLVQTAVGGHGDEEQIGGAEAGSVVIQRSEVAAKNAANAGARMADGLIGVPQAPMSRALARLQGLRLGDKSIVQGVDAFGSRAGSTFRGRGPTAGSDLDLLVRIDPTALGGRSGPWIQRTLRSIADDFEAQAGFPLSIHAPGNVGMFEKSIPGTTFVPLG